MALIYPPPDKLVPQAGVRDAQLQHRAVQDTIAAVFRQRGYDRSLSQTLWDRVLEFLWEMVRRALNAFNQSPIAGRIITILVAVAILLILLRTIIAVAAGDITFGGVDGIRTGAGGAADRWGEAQRLAAAGRYTEAAHALYAALLDSIARGEELRLHPSKTVGDYARDLRRRSSVLLPPFRDFARSYEVVVYGIGSCDQDRYERLYALATGMVQPRAS
jgi:Domain of unknown function (DUF4129)